MRNESRLSAAGSGFDAFVPAWHRGDAGAAIPRVGLAREAGAAGQVAKGQVAPNGQAIAMAPLKATPLARPARPRRGLTAMPPGTLGILRVPPVVRAQALAYATDLRRSPSREALEIIVHRSGCLLPEDQAVMDACYSRGLHVYEIARLQGLDPRVVQRRIKRLSARVISNEFSFVLSQENSWPPTRRRVARAVIIEGRTMRATCTILRVSLHTVRENVTLIYALLNEHLARNLKA